MNNLIENLLLCAAAFAFLAALKFFVAAVDIYRQSRKDWRIGLRTKQDVKDWNGE
jgi:uncharacterized membrane protein YsdA (DUF1294 family)